MTRQAGWIAAEAAFGLLGTAVTTFIVSRLIGPGEVGRAALAGALVMLAQPFIGFCFTNALVQRPRLTPEEVASTLWASLAAALLVAPGFAAAGLLWPDLLGPGVGPVLAALALMLPLNALEGTANGVLLREQRLRALAVRGIAAQVAGLATGVSLALAGAGAWAVVGQQLAFFGTSALLAAAFARLRPLPVLRPDALREMWPFALTAGLSGVAVRMGFRLFILAVAGGLPALAGVLQIAFRIVESARELPSPFVHRYGLPALSRLGGDRAAFLARLAALCRLSGLAFAPLFAGLALCAAELQAVLLGPAWVGIVQPVQLLASALAVTACALPLPMAFVAAGRPGVNLRLTLGGLALALCLALIVPRGDGAAAAAAWAAMLLAEALAASLLAARLLGFGLRRQARGLAVALLPAAGTVLAVLALAALPAAAALSPAALLAAKVAAGALAGGPLILLLAGRAWREVTRPPLASAPARTAQPALLRA